MISEIYTGDCIRLIPEVVEKESVDVVVTSPPYNICAKYDVHDDDMEVYEYLLQDTFDVVYNCLKPNGSFFLNLGHNLDKDSLLVHSFISFITDNGYVDKPFLLQNTIIWVKSISVGNNNFGHFRPINSDRYLSHMFEYVFHFTKNGNVKLNKDAIGVPYTDKTNIKRWNKNEDCRDRGNVWFIPYKTTQKAKDHPSSFPVDLPLNCVLLCEPHNVVLDPFMGIGTTGMAAKLAGSKKFIGFDVSENYCNIAKKRIDEV